MPLNPNLFPSDYGDICPSTQVNEVDELAELKDQILKLRSQHLLNVRRSGISLAELQNQTLYLEQIVFRSTSGTTPVPPVIPQNPPPPVVAATAIVPAASPLAPTPSPIPAPIPAPAAVPAGIGRCYIACGFRGNVHGQTDKFVFANENRSVVAWDLTIARFRHAGFSSAQRGVWIGGQTAMAIASRTNTAQGVNYATEQRQNIAATLTIARVYARATASETKAYIAGNYTPTTSTVDVYSFATVTVAAMGSALSGIVGGCNAFRSADKGYFSSGWNDTRAINSITFATDVVTSLAAQLSVVRIRGSGMESASRGYVAGGWRQATTTQQITIDGFRFVDEGSYVLAKQMTVGASDLEGSSSHVKGYTFGGTATAINIWALNYQGEQWTPVRAVLGQGGRYSVPVGRP